MLELSPWSRHLRALIREAAAPAGGKSAPPGAVPDQTAAVRHRIDPRSALTAGQRNPCAFLDNTPTK